MDTDTLVTALRTLQRYEELPGGFDEDPYLQPDEGGTWVRWDDLEAVLEAAMREPEKKEA